jgi:hypothetical protein
MSQRVFCARTNGMVRTAKSCGPGIPVLMPSLRWCVLRTARTTGAREPVPGESAKDTVKTIAQGMPVVPAGPVVTAACFFSAGGPWVAASTRHSLRPLLWRDELTGQTRTRLRRGNDGVRVCLKQAAMRQRRRCHLPEGGYPAPRGLSVGSLASPDYGIVRRACHRARRRQDPVADDDSGELLIRRHCKQSKAKQSKAKQSRVGGESLDRFGEGASQ